MGVALSFPVDSSVSWAPQDSALAPLIMQSPGQTTNSLIKKVFIYKIAPESREFRAEVAEK